MRAFKYEDSGHTMDGAVVYQYIMGSGHIETCGHTETHLPSTHSKITVVQSRRTPPTRHFFLGLFMSFAFPFRTFFHSVVLQSGKLELLPPRKKTTRSARKKHTRRCERKKENKLGMTLSRLELETFSIPNCASIFRQSKAASRRCDNQLHHSAEFSPVGMTSLSID